MLLRTAQAKEDAKKEVWKIKKDTAQKEKDMADIKKKTLDVEHITACIKRNAAILQYNAIAGNSNSIPLPPLPYIDWMTGIVTDVDATMTEEYMTRRQ